MIRKTPHVDLERIAPTAKLVYAGPFDRAHLDFSVVPYRGADRVIQEVIQSTSQKWSEIQDDGKPRFSDFNTCGLQNIRCEAGGKTDFEVVFYPYYVKLAERGKDVDDEDHLNWIRKQLDKAGPANFDREITYPFSCALLVKSVDGESFILQQRSSKSAQNVGRITSSVATNFDEKDVKGGKLDLLKGAVRGLLLQRGVIEHEVACITSALVAYEAELGEFVYVALARTSLSAQELLARGSGAWNRGNIERQVLVGLNEVNTQLLSELSANMTPFARIALWAGLRDSDRGMEFLGKLVDTDLKGAAGRQDI